MRSVLPHFSAHALPVAWAADGRSRRSSWGSRKITPRAGLPMAFSAAGMHISTGDQAKTWRSDGIDVLLGDTESQSIAVVSKVCQQYILVDVLVQQEAVLQCE